MDAETAEINWRNTTYCAYCVANIDGTAYITAVAYKVIPVCSAIVDSNTAIAYTGDDHG